jgi:hypothetical protein
MLLLRTVDGMMTSTRRRDPNRRENGPRKWWKRTQGSLVFQVPIVFKNHGRHHVSAIVHGSTAESHPP